MQYINNHVSLRVTVQSTYQYAEHTVYVLRYPDGSLNNWREDFFLKHWCVEWVYKIKLRFRVAVMNRICMLIRNRLSFVFFIKMYIIFPSSRTWFGIPFDASFYPKRSSKFVCRGWASLPCPWNSNGSLLWEGSKGLLKSTVVSNAPGDVYSVSRPIAG